LKSEYIPVNIPLITAEDIDYVSKAMSETWVSGEGPYVEEFEKIFATLCNRRFGIAVANGSVAIDLVIEALELKPGDEIILPAFTIISCLNQILRSGATPVFVDARSDTWNMDVSQIESRITSNTKAIMAVHIYGLPVDMDPLLELAGRYDLPVIEDAAEAHGMRYKGRIAGSMGLASTFSFYANKNITTGEGGMIVTDNEEFATKLRRLKNLAFLPERRFVHNEIGWNSRLSSLQCALGTSQTQRLDSILEKRRQIGQSYHEAFSGIANIQLAPQEVASAKNDFWVFGILLEPEFGATAREVMSTLERSGIGTRPFFYPLHKQPVVLQRGIKSVPLPNAEYLGDHGFYIPNGLGMNDHQINQVIEKVSNTLGKNAR
jgi:perosamine synthetase